MFDATRRPEVKPIFVNGIGTVYRQPLSLASDGINYEKKADTNLHNENAITISADRDDWVNDDTTVFFSCTYARCELKIAINSEVGTGLYNNGYFQLSFDRAHQVWSMQAHQKDKEWQFCSPNDALSHVVSILKYLAGDSQKEVESDSQSLASSEFDVDDMVLRIAASIERGSMQAVATASKYTDRDDCSELSYSAQSSTEYGGAVPD